MNDFGKGIAALFTMSGTRQIVQPKTNITNINTKGAAPNQKIGLPLIVYCCSYENNHHFAATITFDSLSVSTPLTFFKSINDSL